MAATKLAKIMLNKGISLEELKEKTGLSHSTLSQMKTGKRKNPSASSLQKTADALGVTVNDIKEKKSKKKKELA